MANLYQHNQDILIHLTAKDIHRILVVRIEGGGRKSYGNFDVVYNNWIPIPEKLAFEVIDMIKEGKICDIEHTFSKDKYPNF